MKKVVRLAVLMLVGAFLGASFLADYLLGRFHGYDHGMGEGPRCQLAGAIVGALVGLGFEIAQRLVERRGRFGVRAMLIGVAAFAVALTVCTLLIRWAAEWPRVE